MMTEQEARTKWCPHVRQSAVIDRQFIAYNRNADDNPLQARCIASDCMSWRWSQRDNVDGPYPEALAPKPRGEWVGFCGLAGKP